MLLHQPHHHLHDDGLCSYRDVYLVCRGIQLLLLVSFFFIHFYNIFSPPSAKALIRFRFLA